MNDKIKKLLESDNIEDFKIGVILLKSECYNQMEFNLCLIHYDIQIIFDHYFMRKGPHLVDMRDFISKEELEDIPFKSK